MLRSKNIDRICIAVTAIALIAALLLMYAGQMNLISKANAEPGYVSRIFDTGYVHTINIKLDDWSGFVAAAADEKYYDATLEIDGETFKNVALRASGGSYANDRLSLKVEFDHYKSSNTYYGLDKLCLNNVSDDTTYMKEYLAYAFMNRMGVAAPLCSYVWIQVNGEDMGLYLAVEAVEDSFLDRIDASAKANLYKPETESPDDKNAAENAQTQPGTDAQAAEQPQSDGAAPGAQSTGQAEKTVADDVKLKYLGDSAKSYSNIFDNAKTKVGKKDKERLMNALKLLDEGSVTECVNVDSVIAYMAVNNFLDNDDGYTGAKAHNYYLLEQDGILSLIPWDYNAAFGTLEGGDAAASVNRPVTDIAVDDRPMASWITDSPAYMEKYLSVYGEFIEKVFTSDWFDTEFTRVVNLISRYVEKDPTAFYGYAGFETGVTTLRNYIDRRVSSVQGQLDGTIPDTAEGQVDSDALIDASGISLEALGLNGDTEVEAAAVPAQAAETDAQPAEETPETSKDTPKDENGAPVKKADTTTYLTAGGCLLLLLAALIAAARYTKRG